MKFHLKKNFITSGKATTNISSDSILRVPQHFKRNGILIEKYVASYCRINYRKQDMLPAN
jgi:hypothetical protein